ncbi:hypothetical protein HYDPIDRAFT_31084 [Hydnomerulius pinastri MD-312]|uniref:Uncharacterized protein n=1 Tax=Hydnomerulius pinastri MD-312 TaxID=994086 RepID=A0A0C9W571_9AGAM|nr:hypothetical protein HYDPIDRAFT_31084 [Hydnomerulius pinastri MD-312]
MRTGALGSLFDSNSSPKRRNRRYGLVWGPNGQASLVGFGTDTGAPPVASPTLHVTQSPLDHSSTPALTSIPTQRSQSLSKGKTAASSIPDLAETSVPGSVSSTSISAALTSSFSVNPTTTTTGTDSASSTTTDTDSSLPSIPTGNAATPTPTAVTSPKDHGYGAPFYLAVVLGSLCAVACVAAFIAWWIRSRSRNRMRRALEDPWGDGEHGREPSMAGDFDEDGGESLRSGAALSNDAHRDATTSEYYLPASIVQRSTADPFSFPHGIPTPTDDRALRNSIGRSGLAQGPYPSLPSSQNPYFAHNLCSMQSPYHGLPSSQAANTRARPNPDRLQTGMSVQESTHTLGKLRVANMVPGDVTSGDEGGMSRPGVGGGDVRLTPTFEDDGEGVDYSGVDNRGIIAQGTGIIHRMRPSSAPEDDETPERPGPATVPWGRRTSTSAALRRTVREDPSTTVNAYKTPRYGGNWHQMLGSGFTLGLNQPDSENQELEDKALPRPPAHPQGWTNTLKSSFMHALGAVAGNRSPAGPDRESQTEDTITSSGFTPAPQRITSRRSLDSQPHADLGPGDSSLTLTRTQSASLLVSRDRLHALHEISGGPITRGVAHYPSDQTWMPGPSQGLSRSTLQVGPGYGQSQATLQYGYGDSQATFKNPGRPGYGMAPGWAQESQAPLIGNEAPMGATIPLPPPFANSNANLSTRDQQYNLPESTRHPRSSHADSGSVYSTDSAAAAASANLRNYGYGGTSRSRLGLGLNQVTLIPSPSPSPAPSLMPSQLALPIPPTQIQMQSPFQPTLLPRPRSRSSTLRSGSSTLRSGSTSLVSSSTTSTRVSRKKGVTSRRKRPAPIQRTSSTASSIISFESGSVGLTIREEAARRALMERRRKLGVAGSAERLRR